LLQSFPVAEEKMATPSTDDLLTAFESIGGQVVQPMALKMALEKRGFDIAVVPAVINQAIDDGVFGKTAVGGLFLRTSLS
jgi:hypothetical protein